MPQPTGIHARKAALKMFDAVLRRGETLEQAAPGALRDVRDANDKALARAIVSEALRWLTDLDALIDSATKKPLPDDAKPRAVLRLMLAQALRLETPPHAVIATGLPLLSGGPRRLAHGVFSTLMKRINTPLPLAGGAGGGSDQALPTPNPSRKREGDLLPGMPTLPAEVAERWGERAMQMAQGLAQPPEVDLALKQPEKTTQWQVKLGGVSLASGHIRVPRGTAVEKLPGFDEGAWWVQDLAAQIPPALLGAGEGKHALDLCAAPGGKTMALAANGWNVTALDMSKRRLDTLKENLKRTSLKASPVRADALKWEPKHHFDAILLDAPCTATGTCRRHPDVLHRIGTRQIGDMVEIQRALIKRAVAWLKPGGVLVYAVCSLESEEGEAQAAWINQSFDLKRDAIAPNELPAGLKPTHEGWLRTHPGILSDEGGLDGFFVARWAKPKPSSSP